MNSEKKRKNNNRLQVRKTTIEASATGMVGDAGLAVVVDFLYKIGYFKLVDKRLPWPKRTDGYCPSDFIKTIFAVKIVYGVEADLSKIDLLRGNEAILKALKMKRMPSSCATGDFLRRTANVEAQKTMLADRRGSSAESVERGGHENGLELLQSLFCETAVLTLKRLKGTIDVTLDFDAFAIEENKKYSKWMYNKKKGVMGYGAFFGGICVMIELEPGNHSPNDNVYERTKSCVELIMEAGLRVARLRQDAAGYVAEAINFCHRLDIEYFIRAPNDNAVKESIRTIRTIEEGKKAGFNEEQLKEYCWHEEELKTAGNTTVRVTLGKATHAMDKTDTSFILAAKRTETTEKVALDSEDLFPDMPRTKYLHWAIATNAADKSAKETTEFYNRRAEDSENRNKELLSDFGVGNLPCGGEYGLEANRAYGYIAGMLYNLMQIFKRECLPEKDRMHRLPTLCAKYIKIPAKVTCHAYELKLSLSSYAKESAKKLRKIQKRIKHKAKRFSIQSQAPNFAALIFRRADESPTKTAMPVTPIILEAIPLRI